jgi:hypothetical protein
MEGHNLGSVSSGSVEEAPAGLGGLVRRQIDARSPSGLFHERQWITASAMCKTESLPEEIATAT